MMMADLRQPLLNQPTNHQPRTQPQWFYERPKPALQHHHQKAHANPRLKKILLKNATTEVSLLRDLKFTKKVAISIFVSKMEGKHWFYDFF